MLRVLICGAVTIFAGACAGPEATDEPGTSDRVTQSEIDRSSSEDTADVAGPALENASLAMSDDALLKRGRIVWLQCRSCHTLKEGEPHLTGPNLHGLMGRAAAQAEGFGYSDALIDSGVSWTASNLDAYLERPDQFIQGNVMAYAGLRKPSDREAIIAYLAEETK